MKEDFISGTVNTSSAELYYRVYGSGSPVLMIHGAMVDADFFNETAKILSHKYRVICYDRRGYSRSTGTAGSDFFKEQAADAAALLMNLCGKDKAKIVGCSAGAIIGMYLADEYPDLISGLIFHEPPVLAFLDSDDPGVKESNKLSELINEKKWAEGISGFFQLVGELDDRAPEKPPQQMDREIKNMRYCLKYEYNSMSAPVKPPRVSNDIPCVLCGGDLHKKEYHARIIEAMSEEYGYPVIHFPGLHNCAYDLPLDFAVNVEGIFSLNLA